MASSVAEGGAWEEELSRLVTDSGIRYQYTGDDGLVGGGYGGVAEVMPVEGGDEVRHRTDAASLGSGIGHGGVAEVKALGGLGERPAAAESLKELMEGFIKASGELLMELGMSCRDITRQSLVGIEDYRAVKNLRRACESTGARLEFLNEFLPEDRDPAHAWPVIVFVFLLALTALFFGAENQSPGELPRKVYIHPPSASHIRLPDGRSLSYSQQGVPAERARIYLVVSHSFLSSRLAGIPGIKKSLLEEFGAHLVSYDLPGFGESDPHPSRNLSSSAMDMLSLADALGIQDKFWVVGHSSGAMHAWAALRYIPSKVAGAVLFAPMVNPYEAGMKKEEKRKTWATWSSKRKLLYILARKAPSFLRYFYSRSFLSGEHGEPEILLSLSLGKKDKALMGEQRFREFWERNIEESIRQGDSKPFLEEAILQVSSWGFTLADLRVPEKAEGNGLLNWLKSFYSPAEREWSGFTGPIHIWQGMDDRVVPPAMTDYVRRVLPAAEVHSLPGEGHFSYFCLCDECHRQVFSTVFGAPEGPLDAVAEDPTASDGPEEEMTDSSDSEMI